jgi:hypothetical protein
MMLQQGALLGQRYEILQILGEGGMGAVYKARDRELNRMVALKVIRPELAGSQAIIDRFKQELLLATQVTHKNVIRIYDLSEAEGMKFITMEFVQGEDLRSLMADGVITDASFLFSVAEGGQEWNMRGDVLHRTITNVSDPAIRVTQPREWRRELHPSSEDRRHGAVTSETVAFFDTPLPDMGAAAAEAWGIHNWSPQR